MFPGKTDKLPVMIDYSLFEGMDGELRTALAAGYGAILEGAGDASTASFLYSRILPDIAESIFDGATLRRIHAMVNSDSIHDVTVYSSRETPAGFPLTVRFTRDSGKPSFIRQHNVIDIPVMRALEHSIFRAFPSRVRGNPLVMRVKMPYAELVRQLKRAWTERPANSYDTASIGESILREMSVWLAENGRPETVRNPEPEYSREDSEYAGLLRQDAEGKRVDMSYHDWKDANLRPTYRTDRMDRGDAGILSRGRDWATPEVMRRHKEISGRMRRNWIAGRNRWDGIDADDARFMKEFRSLASRYNQAGVLATNRELQARIAALIPWLVRLREKKDVLPVKETLSEMMDRVFDLPKDGPGPVGDERRAAMSHILPGAFRSAARRCSGLIDAANHMVYSYGMDTGEKIGQLVEYMSGGKSKKT